MIDQLHRRIALRLVALPARAKLALMALLDLGVLALLALAVLVAAAGSGPSAGAMPDTLFAVLAPALTVITFLAGGSYRVLVRFLSAVHMIGVVAGSAGGALVAMLLLPALGRVPPAWPDAVLYASAGGALLVVLRGVAAFLVRPAQPGGVQRAVIYGAGAAGTLLASALQASDRFRPVAFADDRVDLQGRTLLGLPVLAPAKLRALRERGAFDQILLAIPSVQGAARRRLLESLADLATKVMVVPSVEEIVSGQSRVDALHEVQVEDLLCRESVAPNRPLLERHIRGRSVLVTGAGGSIGGELCRQALRYGAARLVLLDHSEFALYSIQQELAVAAQRAGCELAAVLGSVVDETLLRNTLARHAVTSVYHAAAYKHVPLVEHNALAAIGNNVFGTLAVVAAAVDCGVGNLVLVSTDKAVRPAGLMGASKRVCELVVQARAARQERTGMSLVRFGNVLGSSGSVIPLFQQQIHDGGPVTVTHPDVTRYFMTIGEAAQLVIQAGALGGRGEVFVLDMGEPIRILALAERMIRLAGLEVRSPAQPHGDIAIEFTGLRDGEKLHEELLMEQQRAAPTVHPRISMAREEFPPWEYLEGPLQALRSALAAGREQQAVRLLHELAAGPWDAAAPARLAATEWAPAARLAADGGA